MTKKIDNKTSKRKMKKTILKNINLWYFLGLYLGGNYQSKKGKNYSKLNQLLSSVEIPQNYRTPKKQSKLFIYEDIYSNIELETLYKFSISFQEFIEQHLGKFVYNLSQKNVSNSKDAIDLKTIFLLCPPSNLVELTLEESDILLLRMEEYALKCCYICQSNILTEILKDDESKKQLSTFVNI